MKLQIALPTVLAFGLTMGAVLTTALRAQSQLPAYLIAEVAVHDPDLFGKGYAPKVAATLQPYGGRVVTSGKLKPL